MTLQLTQGQQEAMDKFLAFIADPTKTVFRLEGYAGTGKSTLVKELLDSLPKYLDALYMVDPDAPHWDIKLTATTNKAAEVLSHMSGMDCPTIHSFLKLRVWTDYKTGKTSLTPTKMDPITNTILFVDESSYVDWDLKKYIHERAQNCKIVFMGDRAQLSPVQCAGIPPVFQANYEGAMLTEVMRQLVNGVPAVNPITDLATAFREVVNGSPTWPKIKTEGDFIRVLDKDQFMSEVMVEFTREDWRYVDSKILAWTNKTVIDFNAQVSGQVNGRPHLEEGDYAICNHNIMIGNKSIKTDQLVYISHIGPDTMELDCPGNFVTLNEDIKTFFPKSIQEAKEAYKRAKKDNSYADMAYIDREWVDLRHAYAQTVNKSQGSTYGRVFIDLKDIMRCNSGDQIARMLYVAVSRARFQVNFLRSK